jgi:hypothetical protein
MVEHRTDLARLLLWDYQRGTLPHALMGLLLLLLILLVPGGFWGDPLWVAPSGPTGGATPVAETP